MGRNAFPGRPSGAEHLAGRVPWQNLKLDGYTRTSPVGSYPANGYDLPDMCGNVWEWTTSWFKATASVGATPCCGPGVVPATESPNG